MANKWFSSCCNRYQTVSLNAESSKGYYLRVVHHRGLNCLLYINDMHPAMEHSTIYHFADYTNFRYSCKSLQL